ncbi:glycosyl hydrolase family 3 [Pseudoalteromonas citrea]|uniref:beta-N-acetylhexosaminidase n=1 Tax=Pseudoalteromonas citrea TaxID=43655 RepID=A0A5S3XIQ7_9GAMM|nr:glycoside hydrolase family 3 protein [Pseudoalteromonas citrea]TMP41200.1 glycosyl hydrolase family 3 [Pseudoalteromonas citrea]TMP53889.1 glycosyl hydrolase family 3 [Pseudoalteromonas citrea]
MAFNHLAVANTSVTQQLGQKLMLDFRYYCDSGNSKACRNPMTQLPQELANTITKYHIGGVILFAENVQDTAQIVTLNTALQDAATQPLFIAIDQEGGRVARINREVATSFTGNMSIGATYPKQGTYYATQVAKVIGKELNSLGINVNFAPTVDVNMNAANPVINVRSFSENPEEVAKLGAAQVVAFENEQVISALKHFPGHGDTHVDSHTGLPRVDHDKKTIWQNDLAPFKYIIDKHAPGMIMTAHIQYPALDDSVLENKQGEKMLKPATMSRAIMHDLLRSELNYQGVVVTDALDMAGISDFFDPETAVVETFKAGVDIALMPIAIRTPDDIKKLDKLFTRLVNAVNANTLDKNELAESAQRIAALKQRFLSQPPTLSVNIAHATLGNPSHRKLEADLALAAITQVKNNQLLPIKPANKPLPLKHIHLIMPDTRKCVALEQALQNLSDNAFAITCSSLQGFDSSVSKNIIKQADVVIAAHASPQQSAVEIGGMDDIAEVSAHSLSRHEQPKALRAQLEYAKQLQKPVLFISLRAPYEITDYAPLSDAILASYAYNIDIDNKNQVAGPAFTALARVILGLDVAHGKLPVTVPLPK